MVSESIPIRYFRQDTYLKTFESLKFLLLIFPHSTLFIYFLFEFSQFGPTIWFTCAIDFYRFIMMLSVTRVKIFKSPPYVFLQQILYNFQFFIRKFSQTYFIVSQVQFIYIVPQQNVYPPHVQFFILFFLCIFIEINLTDEDSNLSRNV